MGKAKAKAKVKAKAKAKNAPRRSTSTSRAYKFDPAAETMPLEKIRALQLRRLRASVKNAYENVPFHQKRMKALGFEPGDLKRLEDLAALDFTVKADMASNYPFGLLARPRTELIRLHASSGTTGKPTVVGCLLYTSPSPRD